MKPDGKVRCKKLKPQREQSSIDTHVHSEFPTWVFMSVIKKKSHLVFVLSEVTCNKPEFHWCFFLNAVVILESTDE